MLLLWNYGNIQYILIWIAAHVKTVNKKTSWISPNRKDQPNKEQDKVIGLGLHTNKPFIKVF